MNKYQESFDNIKREVGTPYFSTLYDIDDWKKDISNLQELVDKEKPMKPYYEYHKKAQEDVWKCPKCNEIIRKKYWNYDYEEDDGKSNYCPECGQKLDWSDSNERD